MKKAIYVGFWFFLAIHTATATAHGGKGAVSVSVSSSMVYVGPFNNSTDCNSARGDVMGTAGVTATACAQQ